MSRRQVPSSPVGQTPPRPRPPARSLRAAGPASPQLRGLECVRGRPRGGGLPGGRAGGSAARAWGGGLCDWAAPQRGRGRQGRGGEEGAPLRGAGGGRAGTRGARRPGARGSRPLRRVAPTAGAWMRRRPPSRGGRGPETRAGSGAPRRPQDGRGKRGPPGSGVAARGGRGAARTRSRRYRDAPSAPPEATRARRGPQESLVSPAGVAGGGGPARVRVGAPRVPGQRRASEVRVGRRASVRPPPSAPLGPSAFASELPQPAAGAWNRPLLPGFCVYGERSVRWPSVPVGTAGTAGTGLPAARVAGGGGAPLLWDAAEPGAGGRDARVRRRVAWTAPGRADRRAADRRAVRRAAWRAAPPSVRARGRGPGGSTEKADTRPWPLLGRGTCRD